MRRKLQEQFSHSKCPLGGVQQQDPKLAISGKHRNTKLSVKIPFQALESQNLRSRKRISRALTIMKR